MNKFEFKTFDGFTLSAYKSIADNEKAVVHFVHGAADRIERYGDFIEHLNAQGISFYAFDNRAHGNSEKKEGPYVYLEKGDDKNIIRDVLAFSDYISQHTKSPMVLIGHSMGSFIVRNVAFHTDRYKAYFYLGSGRQKKMTLSVLTNLLDTMIKWKGWDHFSPKISEMGMEGLAIQMMKKGKILTPIEWLTTDPEMIKIDTDDYQLNKRFTVGSYRVLASLIASCQNTDNIKNIDDSVSHIFISGSEDPVGEYSKGIRQVAKLYNKHTKADIKLFLFNGMRHEVLREKDRVKVFDKICDIISSIV